jgi:hypothetical protein
MNTGEKSPEDRRAELERQLRPLTALVRGVPDDRPARTRRRATQGVGDLVEALLTKHRIGRAAPEDRLREKWAEVVGAANAAHSHPLEILPGGRLIVLVKHPVIRQELQLRQAFVVAKIRAVPHCGEVKTIIFRTN